MKFLETRNARLILMISNIFLAGLLIGLGSWVFIISIIGALPSLIWIFNNK